MLVNLGGGLKEVGSWLWVGSCEEAGSFYDCVSSYISLVVTAGCNWEGRRHHSCDLGENNVWHFVVWDSFHVLSVFRGQTQLWSGRFCLDPSQARVAVSEAGVL